MPYPVRLPPPPIVTSLPPEASDTVKSGSSTLTPGSVSAQIPATARAVPTPPEDFAPELSPLKASKSAALLGSPISVGHSVLPASGDVAGAKHVFAEDAARSLDTIARTLTNSDKPLQERSPSSRNPKPLTTSNSQIGGKWDNRPTPKPKPPAVTRILTQERGGKVREFDVSAPHPKEQALSKQQTAPVPELGVPATVPLQMVQLQSPPAPQQIPTTAPAQQPPTPPAPQQIPTTAPAPQPPTPSAKPSTPPSISGIVEVTADRQDYDADRQIVTAEGNVLMRFQNGTLDADRVQVNLPNRNLVATGMVALRRGEQLLRGDRMEYSFGQDKGVIFNASGDINQRRTGTDFAPTLPTDAAAVAGLSRPLSDRITSQQPQQQVTSAGGINFVVGSGRNFQNLPGPQAGGDINRYRFQAERIDFDSEGWVGTDVRITNDPFSPPELEIRANTARFRRIEPQVDEITTTNSRLAFDQGLEVPIFQDRRLIDRRPRDPSLVSFGFDGNERGGLYAERSFTLINAPKFRFRLTPQYLIQRAVGLGSAFNPNSSGRPSARQPEQGNPISPSVFGLRANLDANLSPRTTLAGSLQIPSLDVFDLEDRARGSLRLQQVIGKTLPHNLNLEYSYRDRLFNGSLGFQTVQSSLGAVLTSPVIPLGKTGINLSYQAGAQYINSDTDRIDLLTPIRTNNRINLSRYQTSASLSRGFLLWSGQALPATPGEGLRYTPVPVVPYLSVTTGITGVASGYSSGDTQTTLSGNIGLQGQFGNFSRPFLDYTGFNISYSQVARSGTSPFLFDRAVDTSVLSAGITQQLYGPFRLGFQTYFNLGTGQNISTDYFLEYSRRTYNIILRYNPVLSIGSISLRVNDFNWSGSTEPFEGTGIRPVVQGVTR